MPAVWSLTRGIGREVPKLGKDFDYIEKYGSHAILAEKKLTRFARTDRKNPDKDESLAVPFQASDAGDVPGQASGGLALTALHAP
jgi:hypothetical protein